MRKIAGAMILYMLICFMIPNIFVRKQETKIYNVNKIRLLKTETNEVEEMDFENYLKGVLLGEVPASYNMEALKAQAVVARTYAMYKLKYSKGAHENADMCDNPSHCQAYKAKEYAYSAWKDNEKDENWNKIEKAVNETSGEVITYNNQLINAFFHAHSGGKTEDARYIWGQEIIPYLKSVDGCESYAFEDTKTFSKDEFKKILKEKYQEFDENIESINVQDHTISNRVFHIKIGNLVLLGTDVRNIFGLRSSNFEIINDDNNIIFKTVGYGHGVGMSQEGANQMATNGKDYREIIQHYYTGVEIVKIYGDDV